MSTAWKWYKAQLSARPLLTKALTSATIMSFSDILCQNYEKINQDNGDYSHLASYKHPQPLTTSAFTASSSSLLLTNDWQRTFHVAITGFLWTGPLGHQWYGTLEKVVGGRKGVGGVVVRMILDAMLYSPVAVAGYFVSRSVLEGNGLEGTRDKLQDKFACAVVASWQFWPVANVVNFSLVPLPYRVLYSNSLSLLWTGYLSYLNGAPQTKRGYLGEGSMTVLMNEQEQGMDSPFVR